MPVQYKDFDKDTKDLLNKFYGTAWKIENKYKGPKDTFFINPQAENGKPLTVDVEFESSTTGLKLKANVNPDLVIKPKVTYEQGGNKVEVSTLGDVRELDYEVNYELKEKGYAGAAKVTKAAIEASAVVSVAHHCVVGAGVTHSLSGKPLSYSVATRYNAKGTILTLSTSAFKSFTVGALKGLKIADRDINVATQVNYGGNKVTVTAGAEFACLCWPQSQTIKIRANNALEVGVAVIRKFGDSWKAALSWQCKPDCKNCTTFGLQLVHEPK